MIWSDGEINNEKSFSTDELFIEGIHLPDGTEVVVEYENTAGENYFLSQILPEDYSAFSDTSNLGLLPAPLGSDTDNDPDSIYFPMNVEEGNRNRRLMIKFTRLLDNSIKKSIKITIRLQNSGITFDEGRHQLYYKDKDVSLNSQNYYQLVALRRVIKKVDQFQYIRSI